MSVTILFSSNIYPYREFDIILIALAMTLKKIKKVWIKYFENGDIPDYYRNFLRLVYDKTKIK